MRYSGAAMNNTKMKTAVKVILSAWLIIKIIAGLVTFLTLAEIDLTFFNPTIELAFQVFVFFIKNTTTGLVLFIMMIALSLFSTAIGFFVSSDSRKTNIAGFFACALLILMDIVSALILLVHNGLATDGIFILSLVIGVLMLICLLFYGKWYLLKPKESDPDEEITQGKDAENNA